MQNKNIILPLPFIEKYRFVDGKPAETMVYDVETYKNYLSFGYRTQHANEKDFIFRLKMNPSLDRIVSNELDEMFSFLEERKPFLCGYNNYSFDDVILKLVHMYYESEYYENLNTKLIWDVVQNIIIKRRHERTVEQATYYKNLRYKTSLPYYIKSIDLLAMFFYNPQTTKSLKELGVGLGLPHLQDLPFQFDMVLSDEQIAKLDEYLGNDLNITAGVLNEFETQITLLEKIKDRMYTYCDERFEKWESEQSMDVYTGRASAHRYDDVPDLQGLTEPSAAIKWLMWEYQQETGVKEYTARNQVEFPLQVHIAECMPKVEFDTIPLQTLQAKFQQTVIELNPAAIEKANGDLRRVNYITKSLKNEVMIGDLKVTTGVGGIHSVDYPGVFEEDEDYFLIEKDVVSYYPNLIRALKIYPRHLTQKWNDIYCKSIGERVEEKKLSKSKLLDEEQRNQHKHNSDSLKLRLNGTFGKLGDTNSSVYCPYSMYTVTLSGQLYLLKLIEMMYIANIQCISANTDGILLRVHKDDVEKMEEVCKRWERISKQELEETRFCGVYRHDVNNYIAIDVHGKIKTNGSFRSKVNLKKKNDALVIHEAVAQYFRAKTPVEQTIRECRDINKFVYYYKCTSSFKAFPTVLGKIPPVEQRKYLQKTFRWYKSISNEKHEIHRERISNETAHAKIGDVGKIPKSENAKIINILPPIFPTDIDYKSYINKAKEIIARCSMLKIAAEHEAKAEELRNMGLFPFPKQGKKNPARGFKSISIHHKWKWVRNDGKEGQNHDGYYIAGGIHTGIVNGEDTQTGVFDIDKPEIATEFLNLWRELETPGLIVWHGENTLEDVKAGKCKFKVIFKIEEGGKERHRNSTPTLLKKKGLEYLYGKSAVAWGKYSKDDSEDYYHPYQGKFCDIPEKLEQWLFKNIPPRTKQKAKAQITEEQETPTIHRSIGSPTGSTEQQRNFQEDVERVKKIIAEVLPDWYYDEHASECEHKFYGRCPHEDEHTNASSNTDFDITLKPGEYLPFTGCFHASCNSSINALRKKVNALWGEIRVNEIQKRLVGKITPKKRTTEKKEFVNLEKAFFSDDKQLLINAPTGCGKTYTSALYIIERCKLGEKTLYAAANKLEMRQIKKHLEDIAGETYENLFVQLLESGEKLEISDVIESEDNEDSQKISRNTLVVITNHSYLLRKGEFSNLYYSVLKWLQDNDVDVIIDEFDNYVDKNTYHFPIGARYIRKNRKGLKPVYQKVNTCPRFSGNGSCANCHYRIWQEIDTNNYNLPIFATQSRIDGDDWEKRQKLINLPNWNFNKYKEHAEAMVVPTRGKNGDEFITEYRNIETHKNYWLSKKYRFYLEDGEKYDSAEILRDYVETGYFPTVSKQFPTYGNEKVTQELINQMTDNQKKEVVYPHLPCNVPLISCKDKSIFTFLDENARRCIFLTATIAPSTKQFIFDTMPELNHTEIEKTEQGIDNLLIIGLPTNLSVCRKNEVFTEDFAKYGDVLVFQSTATRALHLYNKLPGDFPACLYRENSIYLQEKFTQQKIHHIITNSRGALGRGVNLANVYVTVCDMLAFKPTGAFDLTVFEPDNVKEQQNLDRLMLIEQNLGRSLRGKGDKIHILYNATVDECAHFAERFAPMVKGKISVKFFDTKEEVKDEALVFLSGDEKEQTPEVIAEKTIEEKLEECKNNGLKWSDARRKCNIDREARKLPPNKRKNYIETLKKTYKCKDNS